MGRVTTVSEDMFDPSALAAVRIHDEALASFEAGLPNLAVLYILYQRVLALKQAPVLLFEPSRADKRIAARDAYHVGSIP